MTTRLIKALLVLALGGLGLVAVSCGGDDDEAAAQAGRHAERPRHGRRRRQPRPRLLVLPDRLPGARRTPRSGSSTAGSRTRPSRRPTSPRTCRRSRTAARRSRSRSRTASSTARRSRTSTVKSADVKYALERCFLPQVGNGYANVYYGDIEGVKAFTGREGRRDLGHRDARRPDARHQDDEAVRRPRRRQRARHALHRAGAEGLRPEVRQGQAVDLRRAPGVHRPVHDRERRQGQDHRLRAEQEADAGPEPELGQVDRLQAGLLRQDRSRRAAATRRSRPGRRSPGRAT